MAGRHFYVEVDLRRFYSGAYPFPVIMLLDGNVLVGMCGKEWSFGRLVGAPGDPYGITQDLLDSARFLMMARPGEIVGVKRDIVREYGFHVEEDSPIYSAASVACSSYIFLERIKNGIIRVHYYNKLLKETDCPKFGGKHKGTVELPLVEFVEDVLRISGEYLREYSSLVEEIMVNHGKEPYDHDVLWDWYREVKKLYEKRFVKKKAED
nr:hypothetical protein [Thermococcus sp. MV11]